METVMNAESITYNQNDKGRFIVSESKKNQQHYLINKSEVVVPDMDFNNSKMSRQ